MRERNPLCATFDVVHRSMALTKGAATGILTAQADVRPFKNKRAKCKRLPKGPVHSYLTRSHFRSSRELAHHLGIQMERGWYNRNLFRDLIENGSRYTRRYPTQCAFRHGRRQGGYRF